MSNKFSQIIENKNPKTKIKKENNFLFSIIARPLLKHQNLFISMLIFHMNV